MNRCSGHCCKRFELPFSPEGLLKALEETRAKRASWKDIEIIQPMVIPIGKSKIAYAKVGHGPGGLGQDEWWDYTCGHFDTKTGDCLIYYSRPEMCEKHGRDYPCATPGCTWSSAKRDIEMTKITEEASLPSSSDSSIE